MPKNKKDKKKPAAKKIKAGAKKDVKKSFRALSSAKKEAVKKLLEKTEENKIKLREKIRLDPVSHSYLTFYHRRYGKYVKKVKGPLVTFLKVLAFVALVLIIFLAGVMFIFGRDLPDVRDLRKMNFNETTRIYDREGNVLYNIFQDENRKYVELAQISADAINATIAIEDKNFYRHFGFDVLGILRAQMKNIQEEKISQGASTITQQLAKNIFLSPEKTYDRKIKELILAVEIELLYSKDEILEMYLNKIAYGSNAYGIEAAAQTFFGKSAKTLNLAEAAVLAALPKAPTYFSPYGQNKKELIGYCKSAADTVAQFPDTEELLAAEVPADAEIPAEAGTLQIEDGTQEKEEKAECTSPFDANYVWGRKDSVLDRMVEDGYITRAQMTDAWKQGLELKFIDPHHKIEAPHYVFYVKELLEKKYGKEMVESGGLEVRTTLDPHLQSLAEESIARQVEYNWNHFRANNAGMVVIDPKTGQVLAMVGSVDYWNSNIDGQVNVTTSFRQPGSAFKPLVYAAAIQSAGIGSGTVLSDYKTVFNLKDVPHNSDNDYKGKMIVRAALAQSRNIPAIKAYYLAGEEEKLLDFLDKLGLTSLRQFKTEFNKDAAARGWTFNFGWPMAIGSGEVKLLDLAGAYGALGNGGKFMALNPILEVRNRKGEILEQFVPDGKAAIDPQAAYIVTDILADAYAKPAGSWRNAMTIPGHTVAAKTGTSNKKVGRGSYPNNNVLVGYTPSLVVGVWVGNTDGSIMRGNAWGFADAGPIWKYFFGEALKDKPDEKFAEPAGIIHKGRELYPTWVKYKDFDKQFKRLDETQEIKDVPVSDLFSSSQSDARQNSVTVTAETALVENPADPGQPELQEKPVPATQAQTSPAPGF